MNIDSIFRTLSDAHVNAKQLEEAKRNKAHEPVARWKQIQEMNRLGRGQPPSGKRGVIGPGLQNLSGHEHRYDDVRGKARRRADPAVDLQGAIKEVWPKKNCRPRLLSRD